MKTDTSGLKLTKERVCECVKGRGVGLGLPHTEHRGWEEGRSWQWRLETVPLRMRMLADAVRSKVVGFRKQCPSCAGR